MSELQSLVSGRIERALQSTILRAQGRGLVGQPAAPGRLAEALHYAVTPGGARIRPTILVSVAMACGDDAPELADAAAAALEPIHCASLVHDDLPCFDDADQRRGKPSVHRAYSEPLAVLAGDSLIVQAFTALAAAGRDQPLRALDLVGVLAARTGMPAGICAGQGWESEAAIDLQAYHMAKTGALFIAATQMGAIAAGQDPEPWTELGARIGAAFQVADDLLDAGQRGNAGQACRAGCRAWPAVGGGATRRGGCGGASAGHSGRGDLVDPLLPGRGATGGSGAALRPPHGAGRVCRCLTCPKPLCPMPRSGGAHQALPFGWRGRRGSGRSAHACPACAGWRSAKGRRCSI